MSKKTFAIKVFMYTKDYNCLGFRFEIKLKCFYTNAYALLSFFFINYKKKTGDIYIFFIYRYRISILW